MNNPTTAQSTHLPQIARTRSGIEYSPSDTQWTFRDGIDLIAINFALVPTLAEPLIHGLKSTLMWYLEHRAPLTARNRFSDFLILARNLVEGRHTTINQIIPEDILAFKISNESKYSLARLRGFLKRWVSSGIAGIGKDTFTLLDQLTLKRNPVGVAVATLDPQKGPFTDLEFEAIQCSLTDAYASGQIDDDVFLLAFLFMALGARPAQFAAMKLCDLIAPQKLEDGTDYILMVPRIKQRKNLSRDELKGRALAYQLGEQLRRHVEAVYARFVGLLPDPWQAPLFPQEWHFETDYAPGFAYHGTSGGISQKIVWAFSQLRVPSERLNGSMHVTPIRFRRTFATRAAEEGLPIVVIAEMMDHANTSNVEIYAGLTSRIRARFSRAVAIQMAPLAQAFSGRIIQSEADATRPDLSSRIVDLRVDQSGSGIGSCGTHSHCGFAKPIACYACNSFEPWLDAPHEKMLDYLLERREHRMTTTSPRIASINDRSILGCAQVILRCRELSNTEVRHG